VGALPLLLPNSYVYRLRPVFHQIYIGYTSDLRNRFLSHNELATKGHTIKYRPWVIAYTEEYQTKTEAIKRENYLKSTRSRKFAWDIIRDKFVSLNG